LKTLKNYRFFIGLFFLFLAVYVGYVKATKTNDNQQINNWELGFQGQWLKVNAPGNIVSDLLSKKIISDPYFGTNEDSIQWIFKQDWTYKSNFQLGKQSNQELVFNGLDTYAHIYINDSLILKTDNMFRKWTVDVSFLERKKDHQLKVVFKNVFDKEQDKINELGYELPGGNRVHTRKAGFHYGWDWGAKITTLGIWKEVEINAWNDATIREFDIFQKELSDNYAYLDAKIELQVHTAADYFLEINDSIYPYSLTKGKHQLIIPIFISQPKKWWPNGYGDQHLYSISLLLIKEEKIIDEKLKKIGLRDVELVNEKDSLGMSFYFKINGKPIFMKGANYIPQDHLQNRVNKLDYLDLLSDAKNSNMNMLRVWGGGIYEQDIFYDICDSLGILIWQDFMFACAMYPSDSLFLDNVKHEAIENVRRLNHHPSIVLWCGNNENSEGWKRWGWQDAYDSSQKKEIEKGYKQLFNDILPQVVNQYAQIPYWESSPSLGRGDPRHQFEGDAHYWGVWHDAEPFENLLKKVPRFMSEFGFQSFPSIETISSFCDTSDFDLNSSSILSHQKHPRGNALILEYIERQYPIPTSFEKLVYLSQVVQSQGIRMGLEAHRYSQPYCMGTLYWQFNDCWPVASWSSRDYFGNWKALNYAVQQVFQPLALSVVSKPNGLFDVWAVSEQQTIFKDTLAVEIFDLDGKLVYPPQLQEVIIKPNTATLLIEDLTIETKDLFVLASLKNKKIKSHIQFTSKPKDMKLTRPNIQFEWKGNKLILQSEAPAFQVYLHGIKGHFSSNFLTLMPGEEQIIKFEGDLSQKNKLLIWSLYNIY
jgi:beta-mannosidase